MKGFGTVRRKQSVDRQTARYLGQIKSRQLEQERIAKAQAKPWENLERRLGVPFRENLLAQLSELAAQNHHPSAIASWVARISLGATQAVTGSATGSYLYELMNAHMRAKHPDMHKRVSAAIASGAGLPEVDELLSQGVNPVLDLAIAAGCESLDSSDSEQRLALVWSGGRDSIKFLAQTLQFQERHN